MAGMYDFAVRRLPVWKRWLGCAIPHIEGPRVLELSFGTGHLLSQYAWTVEAHGVDLNRRMIEITRKNLAAASADARLVQANVEHLPYADASFDTLVNTMAFSGYPDAGKALREMTRVLRPGGRMVMIDIAPPLRRSPIGSVLVTLWKAGGDLIRDMGRLFDAHGLDWTDEVIGGFGSVHLYVATRRDAPNRASTGSGDIA